MNNNIIISENNSNIIIANNQETNLITSARSSFKPQKNFMFI